MTDDENGREPAAVLHDLLTAGTFISYYSETERLLDFVAAALKSVPGVAGCRFEMGAEIGAGAEPGAETPRTGAGSVVAPYAVTIQSALKRYGVALLTINNNHVFQKYQAAVHNFINSVALRMENLRYQTHLEDQIREQTRELEVNRAFLESIFENTGDSLSVVDTDYRIIQANRAAQELADVVHRSNGLKPQPLTGRSCYEAFFAAHEPCDACPAARAVETGTVQERIVPFPNSDNPEHWFAVSAFPIADERGTIIQVIESARNITALKEAQEELSRLLEEKDLLLREVYHRVKNNLNLAVSILNLQFSGFKDPRVTAAARDSINRISSMARVHEFLYQAENRRSVRFLDFVEALIAGLGSDHQRAGGIQIQREVDELEIDVEVAIPVSLITTELVTNAYKYAFPGSRGGTIKIQALAEDEVMVNLTVSDDGVGLPEELDIFHTESLGMQLVVGLTEQIGGTVRETGRDGSSPGVGTAIAVRFPRVVSTNKGSKSQ